MPSLARRGAWIAVTLGAVVVAILAIPGARGALADAIAIAGLRFAPQTALGPSTSGAGDVQPAYMSIEEARRLYEFDVPGRSPEGFSLDRKHVGVSDMSIPGFSAGEALIELEWRNTEDRVIRLSIMRTDPSVKHDEVIARGVVRQVTINGKPAAAVMGAWDADSGLWSTEGLVVLSWRQGRDIYDLMGESIDELISMAKTMPHFEDS